MAAYSPRFIRHEGLYIRTRSHIFAMTAFRSDSTRRPSIHPPLPPRPPTWLFSGRTSKPTPGKGERKTLPQLWRAIRTGPRPPPRPQKHADGNERKTHGRTPTKSRPAPDPTTTQHSESDAAPTGQSSPNRARHGPDKPAPHAHTRATQHPARDSRPGSRGRKTGHLLPSK